MEVPEIGLVALTESSRAEVMAEPGAMMLLQFP